MSIYADLSSRGQLLAIWTASVLLLAAAVGVAILRRWAESRQILDIPNERSSHSTPVPRGGGLMIVAGALAGLACIGPGPDWPTRQFLAFILAAILVAGVSLLDDLRSLSTRTRLLTHVFSASLVIAGTGRVLQPWDGVQWPISALLTLVWIVGLTNAYNFMDGTDGLAGSQAVVAGTMWFLLATSLKSPTTAALGLFLSASSIGFLIHNWQPARIFMGDVGSAFLGFSFAAMPLLMPDPPHPATAVLIVWPFVFDTAFTFILRLRKGENVFRAHRSHLYQRLVIAGRSHRAVALIYSGLALGVGAPLVWNDGTPAVVMLLTPVVSILALSLWVLTLRTESRERPG